MHFYHFKCSCLSDCLSGRDCLIANLFKSLTNFGKSIIRFGHQFWLVIVYRGRGSLGGLRHTQCQTRQGIATWKFQVEDRLSSNIQSLIINQRWSRKGNQWWRPAIRSGKAIGEAPVLVLRILFRNSWRREYFLICLRSANCPKVTSKVTSKVTRQT